MKNLRQSLEKGAAPYDKECHFKWFYRLIQETYAPRDSAGI